MVILQTASFKFGQLLETIKQRSFRGMKQKTQQLDPATRQSLKEFLEDVPEEQEELSKLQNEIDQAHERLSQLQTKSSFIGTRLKSYQTQLNALSNNNNNNNSNNNSNSSSSSSNEHAKTLEQISKNHMAVLRAIQVLEERIEHMEARKQELQYKTEECQAVLEEAEQLQALEQEELAEQLQQLRLLQEHQEEEEKKSQVEMASLVDLTEPDEEVGKELAEEVVRIEEDRPTAEVEASAEEPSGSEQSVVVPDDCANEEEEKITFVEP